MREEWRAVPGFEGYYEASSFGRIRSLDRTIFVPKSARNKAHYRCLRSEVLAPSLNRGRGYLVVTLWREHEEHHTDVHRVIALTFHGPQPPGMYVCHRNGIKSDLSEGNLYYGTPKDNVEDQRRHGTLVVGEAAHAAKLTPTEVVEIRRSRGRETQKDLALRFGVGQAQISRIQLRREWVHVE